MIRTILTEVGLFVLPFLLYVGFLLATRADVLHPQSWPLPRVAWLLLAALILMGASFIYLANYSGAPVGTRYVPAHIENGKFVPGRLE